MRILIADDHAMIRNGLKNTLQKEFPLAFIDEASDTEESIGKTLVGDWDLIICDLSMPGGSGLEVARHVSMNFPRIPVLILSMHPEEQYALRAIRSGASGYLNKDTASEELIVAVKKILLGRKYVSEAIADKLADKFGQYNGDMALHKLLSHREFDVFRSLAAGQSIAAISERLSLSPMTVNTYRTRIMEKMNLMTNADLTRHALENKLI